MDIKSHIGFRVQVARKRKGLTQADLADKIGKAVETISNIERGFALTGIETLAEIAEVVGEPMTYFFEGLGSAKKSKRAQLEVEEKLRSLLGSLRPDDVRLAIRLIEAVRQNRGR